MLDKTIDSALLNLRKRIMRGGGDGLAHVERLLTMRGVDMPAVLPAKKPDAARRGHMRALIFEALRDGPQRRSAIGQHIAKHRPEISPDQALARLDQCLWKMKKAGLVVEDFGPDGCLWRLAGPPNASKSITRLPS
jgi:hypothetical protein